MKRGKAKSVIFSESGVSNLPQPMQRDEHFARARGKHARGYMRFIARKGALVANAKRKAIAA